MITLQKFERLVSAPLAQKPVTLSHFDNKGVGLNEWIAAQSKLGKHEQYTNLKGVLSDILISDMPDSDRLSIIRVIEPFLERVVGQMHGDYIYEHQSVSGDQQVSIHEVRSLYFLMILIYRNVALRQQNFDDKRVSADSKNWLDKILPAGMKTSSDLGEEKSMFAYCIHQSIYFYVNLLLEFALTYQRAPKIFWREINFWYLKAVDAGVEKINMDKIAKDYPDTSIHDQFLQACAASFGNLFAYRRQDILSAFKVFPTWAKYVKSTFHPDPNLKLFINLQGDESPEIITPYASVNPYSDEYRCLFFDMSEFIKKLKEIQAGVYIDSGAQSVFEARFANMVLLAFERRAEQEKSSAFGTKSEILIGFGSVFTEISKGLDLPKVIEQSELPDGFHVRLDASAIGTISKSEQVLIGYQNNSMAQFQLLEEKLDEVDFLSRPPLQVYGLFGLKSTEPNARNPWRLGLARWVDRTDKNVSVDGSFIGRVLMAVGVRLARRDGRGQDFVHALLLDGDDLNQQSTLVLPRYHFKAGDLAVVRIGSKEIEIKLERNVLTTDEIEQYQIVRLNG